MPLQLTAFAYKDYLQFGYVDQGLSETVNLQKQFNINTYAPTMLVFKESTDKPADIIQVHVTAVLFFLIAVLRHCSLCIISLFFLCFLQAKSLKKPIIDEFMANNKFLLVPRLVNQKLFDELCPVKQFHRRRK